MIEGLIIALLVGGTVLVLQAVRIRRDDPVRALVAEFETTGLDPDLDDYHARLEVPLITRILAPMAGATASFAARFLPSNITERIRHQLVRAGLTNDVTAEEFLTFRLLSAGLGVVFGLLLALTLGGIQGAAAGVLALGIGMAAPRATVDRARKARVTSIERELPDSLDLLAISVEAGLGFEQAVSVVVDRSDTVLSAELGHTLREMQLGRSRVEALHELQRRVDVPDLDSLILALVQADALGMPLTRILRNQAAELRRRRRQRVREAAAKLPVKMLFPLVLFILPALFVVVLAPAAIGIMRTL